MTPGVGVLVLGCGHIHHIKKMHYLFKNLFSTPKRQTESIVVMTKEEYTKIVNYITPEVGVLFWAWLYSEIVIFLLLLSTLRHGSEIQVYTNNDQGNGLPKL